VIVLSSLVLTSLFITSHCLCCTKPQTSAFMKQNEEASSLSLDHEEGYFPLSVLTYNAHSCVGSDGVYSVDRIATVIKQANADIVCLQEVEFNDKAHQTTRVWSKPHQDDQPALIAERAGYHYYKFGAAIRSVANPKYMTEVFSDVENGDGGGIFGVALLSKWPIVDSKVVMFAPYGKKTPRNVLACQIEIPISSSAIDDNKDDTNDQKPTTDATYSTNTKRIWVLCTHLGMHYRGLEQLQQAKELILFLESIFERKTTTDETSTVILAGDFNSVSWFHGSVREIRKVLIEANRHDEGTFPAVGWLLRPGSFKLDYIFHSADVVCVDTHVEVVGAVASDHLAFYASLKIKPN